jgi:hypothetical protein
MIGQLALLAERPCQREAVAARQQPIEDRQIGRESEHLSGMGQILERGGGEPLCAKRGEDSIADRLLVLDQHHSTDRLAHRPAIVAGAA